MHYLPAAVALSKLKVDVGAELSDLYRESISGNLHLTHIFGILLHLYQGTVSDVTYLKPQCHHLDKDVLDLVR